MPSILVIDDDHSTRTAVEAVLTRCKLDVLLAPDAAAGLRLVASNRFDAAIVDMFMPAMDGLATVREITKLDPDLPFIAISGHPITNVDYGAPDFLGMAVRLGATSALQKPFSAKMLIDAITLCLAQRNALGMACRQSNPPLGQTLLTSSAAWANRRHNSAQAP